jgi:hypothetical protein
MQIKQKKFVVLDGGERWSWYDGKENLHVPTFVSVL